MPYLFQPEISANHVLSSFTKTVSAYWAEVTATALVELLYFYTTNIGYKILIFVKKFYHGNVS